MGVSTSSTFGDEALTPRCNCCGVALCWDIGADEYEEQKSFWDNWECKDCDPNAPGSRQRYINNNGK